MNLSMKKILFSLLFVVVTISLLVAQSDCKSYHTKKCDGYGDPYKYSGQSKSASFDLGETSSFKMSAFGGFEYSVSLCAERQLEGIYFRILEDTPEKTVLYDGQGDEMLDEQFFIEDSKKLIVEVVVPKSETPVEELDYEDTNGCVGVVIEYRKVGKGGFD